MIKIFAKFALCLLAISHCHSAQLNHTISDSAFEYRLNLPINTYHSYCENIYSQNGEDGILRQILKELKITSGTFCEFGASDGITSSNTFNLIKNYDFSGIAIELNRTLYEKCVINYKAYPKVRVFHGAVLYNNANYDLNSWLKKGNIPRDFDVLSIDIDCDDYYVWENLTEFTPKIVIFETNSYRDPVFDELPGKRSHQYNIDLLMQWYPERVALGCSFISAVKLGLKKGYIPISYTGNLTFVRKDLVHNLKEFPYTVSEDPYDYLPLYTHLCLWGNKWHTNTGLILNTAIRDYYLTFKIKLIDINWINERMTKTLNNEF